MVSQRDRINKLTKYIVKNGISVNIGKNKARGNRGIFVSRDNRIDIAKGMDDEAVISTLVHEFVHYIHYKYDKTLNSYDFIFPDTDDVMREELINVSVHFISKDYATQLFDKKNAITSEIRHLAEKIRRIYPSLSLTKPCKEIEKTLNLPLKYLIKYDRVKYFNQILSVDKIGMYNIEDSVADYLVMKSRQRLLSRINSRISKLNNYYNKPAELMARFVELYYTDKEGAEKIAPKCCKVFELHKVKEFLFLDEVFFAKTLLNDKICI